MITLDNINNSGENQNEKDEKYRLIDSVAKNNPDIPDDLADFIKSLEESQIELEKELQEPDEEELDSSIDILDESEFIDDDEENLEDDNYDENDPNINIISEEDSSDVSIEELNDIF